MILNKITGATAKTGTPYYKLNIDGKNYNYFGEIKDLKQGDSVECTFEQKDGFTNLKTISKTSGSASNAQNTQLEGSRHDIVIQRVEKPHSYEFGPAKQRHKIYYGEVNELLDHIEMLKAANLMEENEFEVQKID